MKNQQLKNYDRFICMCWGIIYLTLLFQFIPQTSVVEAILYPAMVLISCYPLTTWLSRKLLPQAIRRKHFYLFSLQFTGVSLVCGLIYFIWSLFFYWGESVHIFPPSDLFMVEQPLYFVPVFITAGVLVNMIICAFRFFEENLKFQQQLYESELHTLKAQINPHFMFNVLNHIHYYVETRDDLASVLLLKYSDVLRYQLYNTRSEWVPLGQEVQFLKDYIEIEKIRWEDKIRVDCSWITDNPQLAISPLILITPIENAFKHVCRTSEEKGYVKISFKQSGNQISLNVENTRQNLLSGKGRSASGLGLVNLKKRLGLSYYNKHQLSIRETDSLYQVSLTIELQP